MEHNNYERMTVPTLKKSGEREGGSHITPDLENLS